MAPNTLGTRTKASRADRAQADQTRDAIVPIKDKRKGMYLTDFVSITVLTMAKGAAYITILDITAKKPRNFEGEGDINDTVIPTMVAIVGYERVRNKSFLLVEVTNLINIMQ